MPKLKTVAVLGTGLMGYPMAKNLAKAGHRVRAWNRTLEKAQGLSAVGVTVGPDVAGTISGSDIVVSMVADGTATAALIGEAVAGGVLGAGMIWVDMSSTRPEEARANAATLDPLGVAFLDAPVSGGTKGAEAASLAIMVGGGPEVFAEARETLSTMGRPVHVGPVGSGQLAKLANQAIVAATIGAVAEAMLLLETGGANPAAVRDALKGGFADSVILQQHGARMSEGNFVPGGLTRLQVKDLDNVLDEAAHLNLKLPVVEHIRARFARYIEDLDGGERDHSGLYEELKDLNGL